MLKLKNVRNLLLTLLIACAISQNETTNSNLHCFTDEEVVSIEAQITELQDTNEVNEKLLSAYRAQILNYQQKSKEDSLLIDLKDEKIITLEKSVKEYEELNKLMEPKWYDSKWLYYFYGALTVYAGASVASTVGN